MKHSSRSHARPVFTIGAIAALALGGCAPRDQQGARGDAPPPLDTPAVAPRAGYVVDSVLPPAEELRRFRADLPGAPASLEGGFGSRDALGRAFARALARSDSAALRRMVISRAEFAYLVYPESPYTRPPYRQPPWLVWRDLEQNGEKGLRRLLDRRGGAPLAYAGVRCAVAPEPSGASRLWRRCMLRSVRAPGDTVAERLFGVVVEHGGRFKFASYGNAL